MERQITDWRLARVGPVQGLGGSYLVASRVEPRIDFVVCDPFRSGSSTAAQCRQVSGLGKALDPRGAMATAATRRKRERHEHGDGQPIQHAFLYRFCYVAGMNEVGC